MTDRTGDKRMWSDGDGHHQETRRKPQARGKTVDFKELLRTEPDGDSTNVRNVRRGRTATPKVKLSDFELIPPSRTLADAVGSRSGLANLSVELLRALFPMKKAVRLLGVSVSGFVEEETGRPSANYPGTETGFVADVPASPE